MSIFFQASQFGFRCLVVGYEAMNQREQGLKNLEMELAYLGGLCSTSLMNKNISLQSPDDDTSAMHDSGAKELIEEAAGEAYDMHSALLSKGFALDHPPSVQLALDGVIPFSCHSNERLFLRHFVHCEPGTSGSRLAKWLQPESYVDADKSKVLFDAEEMRCNWPTIITVATRDQYGEVVQVPHMRVSVVNFVYRNPRLQNKFSFRRLR